MNGLGKWLAGMVSALISGAANALVVSGVAPETFNLQEGLPKLGTVAVFGALLGLGNFLRQSPLPPKWNGKPRRTGDTVVGKL